MTSKNKNFMKQVN